jgi:hypothetical protein
MSENILLPFAKNITRAELPWGDFSLLAKCVFSCEHLAQSYSIRVLRARPMLAVVEVAGADSSQRICGKLTAFFVPFRNNSPKDSPRPISAGHEYWKAFSKEELIDFACMTKDRNPIHLQESPIVQGLLVFSQLLQRTRKTSATIRFVSPLYAEEKVWLLREQEILTGVTNKRSCFYFEPRIYS